MGRLYLNGPSCVAMAGTRHSDGPAIVYRHVSATCSARLVAHELGGRGGSPPQQQRLLKVQRNQLYDFIPETIFEISQPCVLNLVHVRTHAGTSTLERAVTLEYINKRLLDYFLTLFSIENPYKSVYCSCLVGTVKLVPLL
jgi:hypothetical protein